MAAIVSVIGVVLRVRGAPPDAMWVRMHAYRQMKHPSVTRRTRRVLRQGVYQFVSLCLVVCDGSPGGL